MLGTQVGMYTTVRPRVGMYTTVRPRVGIPPVMLLGWVSFLLCSSGGYIHLGIPRVGIYTWVSLGWVILPVMVLGWVILPVMVLGVGRVPWCICPGG